MSRFEDLYERGKAYGKENVGGERDTCPTGFRTVTKLHQLQECELAASELGKERFFSPQGRMTGQRKERVGKQSKVLLKYTPREAGQVERDKGPEGLGCGLISMFSVAWVLGLQYLSDRPGLYNH